MKDPDGTWIGRTLNRAWGSKVGLDLGEVQAVFIMD